MVALIPLWPAFEEFHEYTHLIFFLAIAPTVFLSLQRKHESSLVIFYLISGLIIIFIALLFHENLGEYGVAMVTLIGSLLLIRGHWMNYSLKLFSKFEE